MPLGSSGRVPADAARNVITGKWLGKETDANTVFSYDTTLTLYLLHPFRARERERAVRKMDTEAQG